MKRSNPDYFNMKPVRGSSPTASLAADLSQNFHIDQRLVLHSHLRFRSKGQRRANSLSSPQLATPRRSLFTANMLSQANRGGKELSLYHGTTVTDTI
jgi:M-phase inducer tyrosine phosphatase